MATPLLRARAAGPLNVTFDGDNLHVAAPQLHFLTGKSLSRLKDGGTVVFLSQITLSRDNRENVIKRVPERLIVSYDVWEERFSVMMSVDRRSASRLTTAAAETWCLDNLAVNALGLAPDRPFWLHFELRAAEPKDLSSVMGDAGISMRDLIELFSRKPGANEDNWSMEAGPLRLADLRRTSGRGMRLL